jgi:pyruvate,water dikinase
LRELGFAVPDWRVVSCRVFDDALESRRGAIEGLLRGIDFVDCAAVDAAAAEIRRAIMATSLPANTRQGLSRALGEVSDGASFAVRSSALGEDSETNSFAGLMDSFVNVPADEVPRRVREVWASAFSARALLYRHRKGISLAGVSAAVIVQDMVPATASGVLFTRDPANRETTCVIAAAYGLGDGVTSSLAEADTYRIGWDRDDISAEVPEKTARVMPSAAGGTRIQTLAPALAQDRVLTDARILSLRDAGRELEARLGTPQDVEWAFDGAGQLWFLQARPIVFPAPSAQTRIWDNANIVESYPGLTLPLTFSFARRAYETTFTNYARRFIPLHRSDAARRGVFAGLLGLIDGRVYYNLLNWYRMIACLPGFRRHKAAWDEMIGIAEHTAFEPPVPGPLDRLRGGAIMIWKLLTIRGNARRFFRAFDPVYRRHAALDLSAASESDLMGVYDGLENELRRHWHLTIDNDHCVIVFYGLLKLLYGLWAPTAPLHGENDLLSGQPGIESVRPVRSLLHLVRLLRDQPTLAGEGDAGAVLRRIRREPGLAGLREALERHLAEFGDRGVEELKLDTPGFRECPEALIELIITHARAGDAGGQAEPHDAARADAADLIRRHVRNPLKRGVLRLVVGRARLAVANRENMRFARSRLFGIARRIFRYMGERFADKGLLAEAADIHYLTVDEVFDFVRGSSVTRNLGALVRIRKAEYAASAGRETVDRIRTDGIPYLASIADGAVGRDGARRATGIGCASGIVNGNAMVVVDPRGSADPNGRILVARSTDPGWVFLMTRSSGLVVEKGSVLSHTAIIGRELGIPTVVGVSGATRRIPDGAALTIDGGTGEVRWH